MGVRVDVYATHENVIALEKMTGPRGGLTESDIVEVDTLGTNEPKQEWAVAAEFLGAGYGDAEGLQIGEKRRALEVLAAAIDGALSTDTDVLRIDGADETFAAGLAGGVDEGIDIAVVEGVGAAEQLRVGGDVQSDVVFEQNSAGDKDALGHDDSASAN